MKASSNLKQPKPAGLISMQILPKILLLAALAIAKPTQDQTPENKTSGTRSLIQVTQLIYHGARTPTRFFVFNSSNNSWIYDLGLGELTSSGARMMYYLGIQTYQYYKTFFGHELHSYDFYIRTTGYNYTYSSAQMVATGILKDLKPAPELLFNASDPRLQPPGFKKGDDAGIDQNSKDPLLGGQRMLNIYRVSRFYDDLMKVGTTIKCPNLKVEQNAEKESDQIRSQVNLSFIRPLVKELRLNLDVSDPQYDLVNCYKIGLFLQINYYSSPNQAKEPYRPGNEIYDKAMRCRSAGMLVLLGNQSSITINGSPLFVKMEDSMKERIKYLKNSSKHRVVNYHRGRESKFNLLVGHDVNMAQTMDILGLFDRACVIKELIEGKTDPLCPSVPNFGANVAFELEYDSEKKDYFVNVKFNGQYVDVCKGGEAHQDQDLRSKSSSVEGGEPTSWDETTVEQRLGCQIDQFYKKIFETADRDWYTACGLYQYGAKKIVEAQQIDGFFYYIGFLVIANVLVLILVLVLLFHKNPRQLRIKAMGLENSGGLYDSFRNSLSYFSQDEKEEGGRRSTGGSNERKYSLRNSLLYVEDDDNDGDDNAGPGGAVEMRGSGNANQSRGSEDMNDSFHNYASGGYSYGDSVGYEQYYDENKGAIHNIMFS